MLNLRLAALFVALSATAALPACGPELVDDEGGETMEGSSGGSTGDATGGSTGGTAGEDVSHEGEPCAVPGDAGACTVDGAAGYEFCLNDWQTGQSVWTACMTEPCATPAEGRACAGGRQYCTTHYVADKVLMLWGVCSDAGACKLGDTADCGIPDMPLSYSCILDGNGVPVWDPEGCNTPLVLSFGEAVEFAPAAASAADFDIHGGAGVCTRADWPSPATPWLALDLDRNGSIDGGHELFGSGTRLAAGTGSPNGFVALAQLDSDGDGKLSASDERWGELVLWADHDGDRRSSGWEALPLASFEVVEIALAYGSRRECDAAGNCGVERASFVYREGGRAKVGEVVDVHLACE